MCDTSKCDNKAFSLTSTCWEGPHNFTCLSVCPSVTSILYSKNYIVIKIYTYVCLSFWSNIVVFIFFFTREVMLQRSWVQNPWPIFIFSFLFSFEVRSRHIAHLMWKFIYNMAYNWFDPSSKHATINLYAHQIDPARISATKICPKICWSTWLKITTSTSKRYCIAFNNQ